jgi:hypothetical protein
VPPAALSSLLATIKGCFPPGTVAAVWFRSEYRANKFTSFNAFRNLFCAKCEQGASDLVALQGRWEEASQRRNQNPQEYHRYLVQLQSQIACIDEAAKPQDIALLIKFCATLRPDLKRYLQEKRVNNPNATINQLVMAASVRDRSSRGPNLHSFDHSGNQVPSGQRKPNDRKPNDRKPGDRKPGEGK